MADGTQFPNDGIVIHGSCLSEIRLPLREREAHNGFILSATQSVKGRDSETTWMDGLTMGTGHTDSGGERAV